VYCEVDCYWYDGSNSQSDKESQYSEEKDFEEIKMDMENVAMSKLKGKASEKKKVTEQIEGIIVDDGISRNSSRRSYEEENYLEFLNNIKDDSSSNSANLNFGI